ncbi:MAG: hypothetical protein ACRCTQ_04205 [Brevinemataceae bacterium]
MVQKKQMTKYNWILTLSGITLVLLGYMMCSTITRDYETVKAFFTILILNLGLLTIILGLSISFDRKLISEENNR